MDVVFLWCRLWHRDPTEGGGTPIVLADVDALLVVGALVYRLELGLLEFVELPRRIRFLRHGMDYRQPVGEAKLGEARRAKPFQRLFSRWALSTTRNIWMQSQNTQDMHAAVSPPQVTIQTRSFDGTCGATRE